MADALDLSAYEAEFTSSPLPDWMVQTPPCSYCGRPSLVAVTETEYHALVTGALAQQALPDREPAFRELFISGTHEHCWNAMLGDEDDGR